MIGENIPLSPSADVVNAEGQSLFAVASKAAFIEMTNRTGGDLLGKEAVIIDQDHDESIVFAVTANETRRVCGVVFEAVLASGLAQVRVLGAVTCLSAGVINRSDIITIDPNPPYGRVKADASPNNNAFGKALTGTTASGQTFIAMLSIDTAGARKMESGTVTFSGTKKGIVIFAAPFDRKPRITATLLDNSSNTPFVTVATMTGFMINFQNAFNGDVEWIAVERE